MLIYKNLFLSETVIYHLLQQFFSLFYFTVTSSSFDYWLSIVFNLLSVWFFTNCVNFNLGIYNLKSTFGLTASFSVSETTPNLLGRVYYSLLSINKSVSNAILADYGMFE